MDSCIDKNIQVIITGPTDCKNSNKNLFISKINSLDKERNFTLNFKPSEIKYGTNYSIRLLIINKYNELSDELEINLTTSKYFKIYKLFYSIKF